MNDADKTKEQLLAETAELRQRICEFQAAEQQYQQTEASLRESEEKHRILLERLPQKIFYKDRQSVYVSCNESYARELKIKVEDIAGKTDYDFHPAEFADKYRADDREVIAAGASREIEEEYILDGQKRWSYTTKTPVKDRYGNTIGILGLYYDITEQRQAAEKISASEARYRIVFEQAIDSKVLIDPDTGRIIEFNKSAHERLGYSKDEFQKLRLSDIDVLETTEDIIKHCEQIKKDGFDSFQTQHRTKHGDLLNVQVKSTFLSIDGKDFIISIWHDITELKKAESLVENQKEQLEIKNIKLEEINTALKVLLEKREEDKIGLEEKILSNIKLLVSPYLEKLQAARISDREKSYLEIARTNLDNIISTFTQKLASKYFNLTPTEIKIANLIAEEKKTKEISEIMHISVKTVEVHRRNIRKKFKLIKEKTNLKTHLLSLK